MPTSPAPPNEPEKAMENQEGSLTPEGRRRHDILSMATTYLSATPGWGERLLPYLFIAMETCWIAGIFIGLASLNLFQLHEPLMPVWSPFVLMAGSYWLSTYVERRELVAIGLVDTGKNAPADVSGSRLVFIFVAIVTLFVVWLSVYTSSFLLDPRWLLAMLTPAPEARLVTISKNGKKWESHARRNPPPARPERFGEHGPALHCHGGRSRCPSEE